MIIVMIAVIRVAVTAIWPMTQHMIRVIWLGVCKNDTGVSECHVI